MRWSFVVFRVIPTILSNYHTIRIGIRSKLIQILSKQSPMLRNFLNNIWPTILKLFGQMLADNTQVKRAKICHIINSLYQPKLYWDKLDQQIRYVPYFSLFNLMYYWPLFDKVFENCRTNIGQEIPKSIVINTQCLLKLDAPLHKLRNISSVFSLVLK